MTPTVPEPPGHRRVPDVFYLAGPTASGKSDVALWLAERLDAEIVSVDCMQVYRGLDIGTAKPTPEERDRIRHHLIDVAPLTDAFDAAQFVRLAHDAVQDIRARGRRALFCGGTGLYFKVWMSGLGVAPASDPSLRAALESAPHESLLQELEAGDPVTFARIDRCNPRRVQRAVEVLRLSGKPLSEQRSDWSASERVERPDFVWLDREREDLQERVNRRVGVMLERGWIEETRRALEAGLANNPVAMQAIGYRLIAEHVAGTRDWASTAERIRIETRQFAKRQGTWFRKQTGASRMAVGRDETPEALGARLLELWRPCL